MKRSSNQRDQIVQTTNYLDHGSSSAHGGRPTRSATEATAMPRDPRTAQRARLPALHSHQGGTRTPAGRPAVTPQRTAHEKRVLPFAKPHSTSFASPPRPPPRMVGGPPVRRPTWPVVLLGTQARERSAFSLNILMPSDLPCLPAATPRAPLGGPAHRALAHTFWRLPGAPPDCLLNRQASQACDYGVARSD